MKEGMICKTNVLCVSCNNVIASYNVMGKPARYCVKCKSEDMINIKKYNNKKNTICKEYLETIE